MQITLLKVLAIANLGWGIPFPWWMWLWGIISEFNGLVKETLIHRVLNEHIEKIDEKGKKHVPTEGQA